MSFNYETAISSQYFLHHLLQYWSVIELLCRLLTVNCLTYYMIYKFKIKLIIYNFLFYVCRFQNIISLFLLYNFFFFFFIQLEISGFFFKHCCSSAAIYRTLSSQRRLRLTVSFTLSVVSLPMLVIENTKFQNW